MSDQIDWSLTTWEGNRRRQHAEFRSLPFREKLLVLEQLEEVSNAVSRRTIVAARDRAAPGESAASTNTTD